MIYKCVNPNYECLHLKFDNGDVLINCDLSDRRVEKVFRNVEIRNVNLSHNDKILTIPQFKYDKLYVDFISDSYDNKCIFAMDRDFHNIDNVLNMTQKLAENYNKYIIIQYDQKNTLNYARINIGYIYLYVHSAYDFNDLSKFDYVIDGDHQMIRKVVVSGNETRIGEYKILNNINKSDNFVVSLDERINKIHINIDNESTSLFTFNNDFFACNAGEFNLAINLKYLIKNELLKFLGNSKFIDKICDKLKNEKHVCVDTNDIITAIYDI